MTNEQLERKLEALALMTINGLYAVADHAVKLELNEDLDVILDEFNAVNLEIEAENEKAQNISKIMLYTEVDDISEQLWDIDNIDQSRDVLGNITDNGLIEHIFDAEPFLSSLVALMRDTDSKDFKQREHLYRQLDKALFSERDKRIAWQIDHDK